MTDWICFIVAFGIVVPWLFAGACLLVEWACKALTHCRRMRTDAIYREVEIQFRADRVDAGLDSRTIPVRSVLWWASVVATGYILARDVGWLFSMRWLWSMSVPLIVLTFVAIFVAAACLNLTAVSFVHRLRARRDPVARRGTDDCGNWDDLLLAAEVLSAQYDAIADGDHRRAAALVHRLHTGFGDESPGQMVRRPRETTPRRRVSRALVGRPRLWSARGRPRRPGRRRGFGEGTGNGRHRVRPWPGCCLRPL